jgi:hypothetical protein
MPPELREPDAIDEEDRELERLRAFGTTLILALGTMALALVAMTALVWWLAF